MKKYRVNKYNLILILLLACHVFFRFYNLEKWASFDWDQIDNAWASLRIILAHKYPLVGMVAKANSGIYIGPLYYYLTALFYSITKLDPIASPILAGITSLFSFGVVWYVTRKLFNEPIALLSVFIYTSSSYIIEFERSQWPVNFIAPISLLIFYFLYKIMTGEAKYSIALAITLAFSFQIHFTSIFYPIIILLSLPMIPFKKIPLSYILLSICIVIASLAPQAYYYTHINTHGTGAFSTYFQNYYHGFHLRRVMQLRQDAFIKFISILGSSYPLLIPWVSLFIPAFIFVYLKKQLNKDRIKLCYLLVVWILVPWFVFSTYKGELSDYYFSLQLYIAIFIFAYLSAWIWERKILAFKILIATFWLYYGFANTNKFFHREDGNLLKNKLIVQQAIKEGRAIGFADGDPQSYLYFYYFYTQTGKMPYKL